MGKQQPVGHSRSGRAVTQAVFRNLMAAVRPLACAPTAHAAVAVSGGADSMALLRLLAERRWSQRYALTALTVDHGLRPAAGDEARQVAAWCQKLDIAHRVLRVNSTAPTAGIQAWARTQRYHAMLQFCLDNGIQQLFLGHHRDDQLETLVHRLRRDSGVEGLAGMAAAQSPRGVHLLRPLLSERHADLMATCRRFNQEWIEDPSNHDRRYQRVRDRMLVAALPGGEADRSALRQFAETMARMRQIMDHRLRQFFMAHGKLHYGGWVTLQLAALRQLPEAASGLLLSRLLRALGGAEYPPRTARLSRLLGQIYAPNQAHFSATLSGCMLLVKNDQIIICREWQKVVALHCPDDGRWHRWDNRFEIRVCKGFGAVVCSSLGEADWADLRRDQRLHALAEILECLPMRARAAFPIMRKLDDGRVVNQVQEDHSSHSGCGCCWLEIKFRPNGTLLGVVT